MINICLCISTFDACKQIFWMCVFIMSRFMVYLRHLIIYHIFVIQILIHKFFINCFSWMNNVVQQRTNNRYFNKELQRLGSLIRTFCKFRKWQWIHHTNLSNHVFIISACHNCNSSRFSRSHNICLFANDMFNKIRQHLHIKEISISNIWFFRSSTA